MNKIIISFHIVRIVLNWGPRGSPTPGIDGYLARHALGSTALYKCATIGCTAHGRRKLFEPFLPSRLSCWARCHKKDEPSSKSKGGCWFGALSLRDPGSRLESRAGRTQVPLSGRVVSSSARGQLCDGNTTQLYIIFRGVLGLPGAI